MPKKCEINKKEVEFGFNEKNKKTFSIWVNICFS